jgi:hypothetical protein
MKTPGVSSRGEFKINGGFASVGGTAAVGVFVGGIVAVGGLGGGMDLSHAARNDAARIQEDVFRKSRREKSLFICSLYERALFAKPMNVKSGLGKIRTCDQTIINHQVARIRRCPTE